MTGRFQVKMYVHSLRVTDNRITRSPDRLPRDDTTTNRIIQTTITDDRDRSLT